MSNLPDSFLSLTGTSAVRLRIVMLVLRVLLMILTRSVSKALGPFRALNIGCGLWSIRVSRRQRSTSFRWKATFADGQNFSSMGIIGEVTEAPRRAVSSPTETPGSSSNEPCLTGLAISK